MKKEFRPGSEGAAQQKSTKRFLIGATVIVCLIFSMCFLNLPHTFLNDWHKHAGIVAHIFSFIFFAGCILFMGFGKDLTWGEKGGWETQVIAGLLLLAAILLSSGFYFDL